MRGLVLLLALAVEAPAQVYSPRVLVAGQPDASDLSRFANGICDRAGAKTPRARAEAIWRFFLTDGRFVAPGFWYHIAGWTYEEPMGEVLDPLKLINSYGFGLCYHIAPLLASVWKAAGFEDARVWFLTGHTVAEVFYDGAYHYYDSDMLGYSTIGGGSPRDSVVASVHQLEANPSIMLSKLAGPRDVHPHMVDHPWYPADVRAGAIESLASLFASQKDNSLFPFDRSPSGYRPDFVLRPGERLIRYFHPEQPTLYYLPYTFDGRAWTEFPQESTEYKIRTSDGPRSQKDERTWGTGRFEYRPPLKAEPVQIFTVQSPYVIIDAAFTIHAVVVGEAAHLDFETSTNGGRTWVHAGALSGPFSGDRTFEPAEITRSTHGRLTAVSGRYGYLVKLTKSDSRVRIQSLRLVTRVQLNPRTLPELVPGHNQLVFSASRPLVRTPLDVSTPAALAGAELVSRSGQSYWRPTGTDPAEFVFRLAAPDHAPLEAFTAGARFLDLNRGLAPDKLTAEVRGVTALNSSSATASIAWSTDPKGPFQTIWTYDPHLSWKDGSPIDRTLAWPEVDLRTATAAGTRDVYVQYRFVGLALDDFRLSVESKFPPGACALAITHQWNENGSPRSATHHISAGTLEAKYVVDTATVAKVTNEALILTCLPAVQRGPVRR